MTEDSNPLSRRRFVQATSVFASLGIAGCGGGGGQNTATEAGGDDSDGGGGSGTATAGGGGEKATLELWHDKGKNPNWNPGFEAAIPVVNENLSASVSVEAVPYQSTSSYQGALRPVLGTSDGPAFFSYWTGARLRNIVQDDFAVDITDVWQKHIDAGEFTESLMEPFSVDGKAYATPSSVAYWPVWYNTETFDKYGVEAPSTWEGFKQVAQTIQDESGGDTAPIAHPLAPSWTGFVWYEDLLVKQNPEFYNELAAGNAKYTDQPSVEALERIRDFAEKGYFGDVNKAFSLGLGDVPKAMEQEDYAMLLMGSWISGSWTGDLDFSKYDWFALPSIDQSLGKMLIIEPGPFVPHAGHPNTEGVKSVADGLLSTEFQQKWNETLGFIPPNKKVDTSYLSETKSSLAKAVGSGDYSFPLRYWEKTSPKVAVPASKTMKKVYNPNVSTPEKVAQEMEKLRQDHYGDV